MTGFGEESEPSPASSRINWQSGQTVTLSGIQAAPGGRNIATQRFYRSQSGSVGTDFYFIAERAASAANFVDTVAPDAFAEPLPSRHYNAPLDRLLRRHRRAGPAEFSTLVRHSCWASCCSMFGIARHDVSTNSRLPNR